MSAAELDQLATLHGALVRNAVDFRRRGRDCCAQEAEQIAARLAEAMREAGNA